MGKLTIFICLTLLPHWVLKADPIIIAIADFPPSIDLSDEKLGIHGAIILHALKKADIAYKIKFFSWTKISKMLSEEDICSFGWVKNKARLSRWQYSRPYHADVSYLWGRKDNNIALSSLLEATKYKIGVTREFSYGETFDSILKQTTVEEGFSDTVNLRKLLAGRIDLFPGQALIVEPILRERFPGQAHELEAKIEINRLGHHFVCNINSQRGKVIIEKMNTVLPQVSTN